MTWSIVARDASGALGVAVASRFFAVGALCPHARSGVGALATQALVNPLYAPRGLELLVEGVSPTEVVAALTGSDEGHEQRQLHLVDAQGRIAAYTGAACIDWCGHEVRGTFSVAGDRLFVQDQDYEPTVAPVLRPQPSRAHCSRPHRPLARKRCAQPTAAR